LDSVCVAIGVMMEIKEAIQLTKMKSGQSGVVVGFAAGHDVARRLEAMGLRLGKTIKKLSGEFWGPVTVQVGHTQIGIGRGMASKVMVEVEE